LVRRFRPGALQRKTTTTSDPRTSVRGSTRPAEPTTSNEPTTPVVG
jgi:hypothetical protein